MRKLVLILVSIFALSLSCEAQEVVQTGKTFEVKKKENKKNEPVATGYTITVDGITYPIYKGARGGYFYYVVVNGEQKKRYVPVEVKQKLKEAGV
jgi:hypothetical protein